MQSLITGAIDVVILVPVMIAFAAIIFRNPGFKASLPLLTKLVFFSSMWHQIIFSLRSSLPFAIGQIQDAGLIFLSNMATTIYTALSTQDDTSDAIPEAEKLSTVLVALSGSTAMLGASLWLIGRLQLASIIQYLPLPVIGGYLAYIGMYCFEAGAADDAHDAVSASAYSCSRGSPSGLQL